MTNIIVIIIIIILLVEVAKTFFGWGEGSSLIEFISDVKHNRAIEKEWRKNGRPIVAETVGWRPDPWGHEDGMKNNGNGSYSRLIRGGTKEYREKFAAEVEKAKHEPNPLQQDR